MKKHPCLSFVASLMAVLLLASACSNTTPGSASGSTPETGTPQYVTREDLKADIDAGGDGYVILDVRKAADYAQQHIQGAYSADVDPSISGSDDATSTANLKAAILEATGSETGSEDDQFALVCYSGKKYAEKATSLMEQMGVAPGNIFTLEGGQNGWAEAGDAYTALLTSGQTDAPEAPAASDKLLTPDALEAMMAGQEVKIFDLRDAEDYEAGHIPGAMNINNKEFENPDNPVDGEIATVEQFEALMSSYGVTSDDVIVTYASASKPQMAPRLIWTLQVYGHTNTYLLDGHYEQWEQSGKEIETGAAPAVEPSEYKVISADDHSINVDKDAVINKSENAVLLDARPTTEYLGETVSEGNARGGHIPGAVNVPYMSTVDENGLFYDVDYLTDLYSSVGVTPDKEIIVYCQRGHRASHSWFVLEHILGYDNVKVYDGSMMEWSNLMDQPISTESEVVVDTAAAGTGSSSSC